MYVYGILKYMSSTGTIMNLGSRRPWLIQDSLHINLNRESKIVYHLKNASCSDALTAAKKNFPFFRDFLLVAVETKPVTSGSSFRLGFADGIFQQRKATSGKSVCFRRLTGTWLSHDFSARTRFIDNCQNFQLP